MPLSRMRWVRLARIIGVLLAAAALAACSTLKLAYNNFPELSYWWLDGYLDFDGAQTPRVRDDLAELLAWHRRHELPRLVELLRGAQALAPEDITPQQACAFADQIRERLLAVAVQAEGPGTGLALSLGEAQLQQLERKYAKNNAEYRKEWLERGPARWQEKRYERIVERNEDFYGRLEPTQRELLKQQVAQSGFDPPAFDAERRRRQQEVLALLRRFQAERTPPAEARAAIHAYVLRIADPPPGPWRERQQALQQEGCRNLAALHNSTSAAQREQAVRRLQAYERELGELFAAH
ncbi:DUF6279 family lipoprotein [Variovorax sp. WS11]|uniref:DUF6279 family lipoprotein n=1 Tax=Variovorax sp. WS11 TaxID=1105204 RepID=UPI001EF1E976|nr:DUF6279 family lipoprotein [Variovorax sp. WS11]